MTSKPRPPCDSCGAVLCKVAGHVYQCPKCHETDAERRLFDALADLATCDRETLEALALEQRAARSLRCSHKIASVKDPGCEPCRARSFLADVLERLIRVELGS